VSPSQIDIGLSPIPVTIKTSNIGPTALQKALDRLDGLPGSGLLPRDATSFAYVFDPSTQKIQLTSDADELLLSSLLGDSWPLITFQNGQVRSLSCYRFDDCSPFSGGAAMRRSDDSGYYTCTSGFTVVNSSGTRGLAVPAHCNDASWSSHTFFTPDSGRNIGTSGNRHCASDGNDVMLISGKSYSGKIWAGSATDAVAGAGDPAVGATYSYSGATTGVKANQYVESVLGQFWTWDGDTDWCGTGDPNPNDGFWTSNLIRFSRNNACDALPGDSGAPFYWPWPSNPPTVDIRGFVIASWGGDCYAMKYSRIHNALGYSIYIP
jgi:hypothetical protein